MAYTWHLIPTTSPHKGEAAISEASKVRLIFKNQMKDWRQQFLASAEHLQKESRRPD